jgi:hypothetical protein
MKMRPGFWLWCGVAAYVTVADGWLAAKSNKHKKKGSEIDPKKYSSMSSVWWDGLKHPIRRWPVMVLWGFLTAHLFEVFFPEWVKKYDPINRLAEAAGKRIFTI